MKRIGKHSPPAYGIDPAIETSATARNDASCEPIDITAFLFPISEDHPAGRDLRYAEIYDHIKSARRSDDPLDQGEWRTTRKTADWREVDRLGRQVLMDSSKDLQIAAWVAEAWVHLHGFAGLAAGFDLIRALLQYFWETLYPRMEEGDAAYRIGPLVFLNDQWPVLIRQTPLCDPAHAKGYGYFQWEESRIVGWAQNADKEQKKRREALIEEGKISGEAFAAAVNAGSMIYYRNIVHQLRRSREALAALDTATTELFAPDPPGFSLLMQAIDQCTRVAEGIYQDKSKSEIAPQENAPTTASPRPVGPSSMAVTAQAEPIAASIRTPAVRRNAICDICVEEMEAWDAACLSLAQGNLKSAMDRLLSGAAVAPSTREKSRYQLLLAKLCLRAGRADLAAPIVEELYKLIETLNLEQWEHPSWLAEVAETLYRCLTADHQADTDRARGLFQKLCLLNVTRAAAYRMG